MLSKDEKSNITTKSREGGDPNTVELFNAMSENMVFTKTGCWFDMQNKPTFLLRWAGFVENVNPGLFECRSANPRSRFRKGQQKTS